MATKIQIYDTECTLDFYGDGWTSEDKDLEDYLNLHWEMFEVSGADPNPPHSHALEMANALGGTITDFDEIESKPGVVY